MVVDSDKTATELLKIMNRRKMPGSATFMPLNKLNARRTTYPDNSVIGVHRFQSRYTAKVGTVLLVQQWCNNTVIMAEQCC